MQNKKRTGFTLVELLVVIAIIGLLSTIAFIALNQARGKARDAKRVSDIRQLQSALELFYNDNNVAGAPSYPAGSSLIIDSTVLPSNYVAQVPVAPTPLDGSCQNADNSYYYNALTSQTGGNCAPGSACGWYTLGFCLGGATGNLTAGPHTAEPSGIR